MQKKKTGKNHGQNCYYKNRRRKKVRYLKYANKFYKFIIINKQNKSGTQRFKK